MRKPVTFRLDGSLLERARQRAITENRTLTNFVETAVLRALSQTDRAPDMIRTGDLEVRPALEDANK